MKLTEKENKEQQEKKQEKIKKGLEQYKIQTQEKGTGDHNELEKETEQAKNTGGLSEGFSAERLANLVVGMILPMIEKHSDKVQFEQEYKFRTVPALELIEVQELTQGMSAGEIPEWARWTILFGALTLPALAGVKKYTSLLDKIKPKKSKRKKEREKDKKEIEKEKNQGKEGAE